MSRTIKEIYAEALKERAKRMELSEFDSDSKLSVMNGLTWVTAAIVHSFETILDVFAVDISNVINSRVNGTPTYYANALLQYQKGDTLTVREDGLAFGYADIDETKRIITQVSYTESSDDRNLDSKLILKVATGENGNLTAISQEELVPIISYINKIKFAGTRVEVISHDGDVLVPRLTVYYDGAIPESDVYTNIEEKLKEYIMNIPFDSSIYVSKVIESIRSAGHVTDVYIDEKAIPEQGVFLASYDTDGHLGAMEKIYRMVKTSSGFLKESTAKNEEKELPTFRQAIKLIVE
ncbi:hypothetical protein DW228_05920 [Bacteroides fragilis]|uniref:Baseplate protein J-like domain-containing protein n=1 Tax=Bacteroides fragilis TaxID=817 RepID=A0A396C5J6_BACFG|nr:hypothetical protein [Bacteroides fragilis]RHH14333.1 hypothetical protein DW228_05920 [Bacteroides fragilis]